MENETNVDLEAFQAEVWKEYENYKSIQNTKIIGEDLKEKLSSKKYGCLTLPFIWIAVFFTKKAHKDETKKRNYLAFAKEAEELISAPEIKKAICSGISKLDRKIILTEKKYVKFLTKSLCNKRLVKKFVIPQNAVLYGIIAFQIFENGIENYCSE